jgi:hypothetical protein
MWSQGILLFQSIWPKVKLIPSHFSTCDMDDNGKSRASSQPHILHSTDSTRAIRKKRILCRIKGLYMWENRTPAQNHPHILHSAKSASQPNKAGVSVVKNDWPSILYYRHIPRYGQLATHQKICMAHLMTDSALTTLFCDDRGQSGTNGHCWLNILNHCFHNDQEFVRVSWAWPKQSYSIEGTEFACRDISSETWRLVCTEDGIYESETSSMIAAALWGRVFIPESRR